MVLLQAITYAGTEKTERQRYTVVQTEGEVEIRFYPEATLATVYSDAKSYKELASPGFRKLAGYIFGGNEDKTKIAMTAPVRMDINDSGSAMSFVMPSGYDEKNLPKPDDSGVLIQKTPEEYVAAIEFGGYASDEDIKLYSAKLKSVLDAKGITYYGNFRFLGYNPPYQVVGRRNEVIISVNWKSSEARP